MDCSQARQRIEAGLDGELDLDRQLELEQHLKGCPACARLQDALRARRGALRGGLPRFAAPPHLVERVQAALRAERAEGEAPRTSTRPARGFWLAWNGVGLAAAIALAVLAGFSWGGARARSHLLVDEAISAHLRSLQANHLFDVASTDQHTVKPWFAGKLDFSPPVADLAAQGFPLAGGRLEHLDGRSAAALVYHRRLHTINLFIWSSGTEEIAERNADHDGFHSLAWSRSGLNFLAVSDIPYADLKAFVAAFQAAD